MTLLDITITEERVDGEAVEFRVNENFSGDSFRWTRNSLINRGAYREDGGWETWENFASTEEFSLDALLRAVEAYYGMRPIR